MSENTNMPDVSANPDEKEPLYFIKVGIHANGGLDFTSGGMEDAPPTLETVKAMVFGKYISKTFNDVLKGDAIKDVYNLISEVINVSADELGEDEE
jgi:hypothetical protein